MRSQGRCGRCADMGTLTLLGWLAFAGLAPGEALLEESESVGLPPATGVPPAALHTPEPPAPARAVPVEPLAGPALRLVLFDVQGAAPGVYETMTREVKRLFRDLDIEVSWRRAAPGDVTGPDETQVILLNAEGTPSAHSRQVLGSTQKRPLGAVWAFLPNVAVTLGISREAEAWSLRQREEMACALGRVIAHELIHVVTPGRPHSRTGLMSYKLDRGLLVDPGVHLDPATALAFTTALLSGRPLTGPASAPPESSGPAIPN